METPVPTRYGRNAPMMIDQALPEALLDLPQEWKRARLRDMQRRRAGSRVALRGGVLYTHPSDGLVALES